MKTWNIGKGIGGVKSILTFPIFTTFFLDTIFGCLILEINILGMDTGVDGCEGNILDRA